MSQVTVTVGGRKFAIACQPEDETHVETLGSWIDAKFQQLAPRYSQNLLFATLQLADDLHRAQEEAAEARKAAELNEQEAKLARGQQDELTSRIAELEQEVERLQAAFDQDKGRHEEMQAELERLQAASKDGAGDKERLEEELASLRKENEGLRKSLEEAEEANDQPQGQTSFIDPSASPSDPELVPSLERFAELLENCAAKLESAGQAS